MEMQLNQQMFYKLKEIADYDSHNKSLAFDKALEWGKKIPIGILYQEDRLTYESQLPQLAEKPLVEQSLGKVNLDKVLQGFQ